MKVNIQITDAQAIKILNKVSILDLPEEQTTPTRWAMSKDIDSEFADLSVTDLLRADTSQYNPAASFISYDTDNNAFESYNSSEIELLAEEALTAYIEKLF